MVITVEFDGELLIMTICDNGEGFDPEETGADRLGLAIMAERAESVGAYLRIDAAPGKGTSIDVSVPIGHGRD